MWSPADIYEQWKGIYLSVQQTFVGKERVTPRLRMSAGEATVSLAMGGMQNRYNVQDDPELKMIASNLYWHRELWLKETP